MDITSLPQGFTLEHDTRTITGTTAARGFGLRATQPHYVIHNVPETLETEFIDFLDARAEFFEWDDTFPAVLQILRCIMMPNRVSVLNFIE